MTTTQNTYPNMLHQHIRLQCEASSEEALKTTGFLRKIWQDGGKATSISIEYSDGKMHDLCQPVPLTQEELNSRLILAVVLEQDYNSHWLDDGEYQIIDEIGTRSVLIKDGKANYSSQQKR